ncbi:Sar s 3 allergen (serine protease-like protein 14) [Sarcoptes scabiei]|uniref:Sar s 3 allergen (Serine protease-like protein 14) n=1 Tax=Sarcoptes scabiei TaxID=52283 RepID=A0A132ALH1_SARSC|nr:Sar s 3 allergen (serine protease-like protein 14) [Sarcoptes scabiei]
MSLLLIICFLALLISPSTAIIGGEPSPITDEPWTVAIYLQNNYTCGGSILSSRYILTAAHCVDNVTLSDISILYGTAELLVGGKFTFAKKIYFLRYDPLTFANNIAIIETRAPMQLDYMTCKPIDLPKLEFDPMEGTEVLVSGWGDPDPQQQIWAGSLKAANFTVIMRSKCQEEYKAKQKATLVTYEVFCAGGGNVSIESHDAGDPAVQDSMLVGVASYPSGYEPKLPSIFTRVGAFVSWIREIIGKA